MGTHSFNVNDTIVMRGVQYLIKGFRPVGGMQGLMLIEAHPPEGECRIQFVRVSDVVKCVSLASVA